MSPQEKAILRKAAEDKAMHDYWWWPPQYRDQYLADEMERIRKRYG